jgi:hypothetical protein
VHRMAPTRLRLMRQGQDEYVHQWCRTSEHDAGRSRRTTEHDTAESQSPGERPTSRLPRTTRDTRPVRNSHQRMGPVRGALGRAKELGWWRKYGITDYRYLRMEDAASHAYEFQIGYLPELLQTEHYARMTFTDDTLSQKTINGQVTARMTRHHRLTSRPQLHLHAIVHDPVLHQGVRDQLTHLIKQAQLPNVTFQVLPQARGPHPGQRPQPDAHSTSWQDSPWTPARRSPSWSG